MTEREFIDQYFFDSITSEQVMQGTKMCFVNYDAFKSPISSSLTYTTVGESYEIGYKYSNPLS